MAPRRRRWRLGAGGMPPMRSLGVVPRLVRRLRTRGAALGKPFRLFKSFSPQLSLCLGGVERGRRTVGRVGPAPSRRLRLLLKVFGVLRAMPTHELIGETRLSRLVLGRADFVSMPARRLAAIRMPLPGECGRASLATVVLRSSSDMASSASYRSAPALRATVRRSGTPVVITARTTFGLSACT